MPEIFINLGGTSSWWGTPQDNSKKDDTKKDDTQKPNDLVDLDIAAIDDNTANPSIDAQFTNDLMQEDNSTSLQIEDLWSQPEISMETPQPELVTETPSIVEESLAASSENKDDVEAPLPQPEIENTQVAAPVMSMDTPKISMETPVLTPQPAEEKKEDIITEQPVAASPFETPSTMETVVEKKEETPAVAEESKKEEKKSIFWIFGKKAEKREETPAVVEKKEETPVVAEELKKEEKKSIFWGFGKKAEKKEEDSKAGMWQSQEIKDLLSDVSSIPNWTETANPIVQESSTPASVPEASPAIITTSKEEAPSIPVGWQPAVEPVKEEVKANSLGINLWNEKKEEAPKAAPAPNVNTFKINIWWEAPKKEETKTEDIFKKSSAGIVLEGQKQKDSTAPVIDVITAITQNWISVDGIDENIQKELFKKAQKRKKAKKATSIFFIALLGIVVLWGGSYVGYQNKDNLASILWWNKSTSQQSWNSWANDEKVKELQQKNDELTKKMAEIWSGNSEEIKKQYEGKIADLETKLTKASQQTWSAEKDMQIKQLTQKNAELEQKIAWGNGWNPDKIAQLEKQLKEKNDIILKIQAWTWTTTWGVAILDATEVEWLLMDNFYSMYQNDFNFIKNSKSASSQKYLIMLNDCILNYKTKKYDYRKFRIAYDAVMIDFLKQMK